jgi:hypothetical protein
MSGRIDIRAKAEVSVSGGPVEVILSSGILLPSGADAAYLKEMEDAQLSELRRQLYAAGYSKRAIATAVKVAVRVEVPEK